MIRQFTTLEDALCAFRRHKIKRDKWSWILFLASIILAVVCPFLLNYCFCYWYPFENSLLTVISTISVGYLTGFMVYIFNTFLPSTKREVQTRDKIYFNLYLISNQLNNIDVGFTDGHRLEQEDYNSKFYNYLVKDANIQSIYKEESLPEPACVKNNHHILHRQLSKLGLDIQNLVSSHGRYMKGDEIESLMKMSALKEDYLNAIDNEKNVYKNIYLVGFIDQFYCLCNIFFRKICHDYELYKYDKYIISRFDKLES